MNMPQIAGTMDRTTYVGGSAIGAILGVSPFKTSLQLYREIVGEAVEEIDAERARFFKRRKRQEPIVAEILREERGYDLVTLSTDERPNRYIDASVPYFAAEIDFEFRMNEYARRDFPQFAEIPDGTLCNGEIKTVHPLAAADFGDEGTDQVPIYYTGQCLWGLGVTPERPACLLVALVGFDDVRCYPILRDAETIDWMREKAREFWSMHVEPRVPPDPQTLADAQLIFAKFNGRPVDLDEAAYTVLALLQEAREAKKAADEVADQAERAVALAIARAWDLGAPDETADNAVLRYQGRDVATWKLTRGAYLDQKRLKADHAALVEQYKVEHFYRAFRFKKAK